MNFQQSDLFKILDDMKQREVLNFVLLSDVPHMGNLASRLISIK